MKGMMPAALLLILLAAPGSAASEERPPIRLSAQIIRFPQGTPPESFLSSLAAAGVEEAIIRVFSNPGDRPLHDGAPSGTGVLFATGHIRSVADLWSPIRTTASRAGIATFPWMATRSLPLDAVAGGRFEESLASDGGITPSRRLSLFPVGAIDSLLQAFGDLAETAGGRIYLQDDLVLRWGEPVSSWASTIYLREGGPGASDPRTFASSLPSLRWSDYFSDPGRMPAMRDWFRWKAETLAAAVFVFQEAAGKRAPGTILVPSIPYEVPAQPDRGLAWYGLSLDALRRRGIPEVAVMAYHRQMTREMGITGDALRDYLKSMADGLVAAGYGGERSLIKLQGVDWTDGSAIPAAELNEAAAPFREAGFTRFAVVLSDVPFPAGFPGEAAR